MKTLNASHPWSLLVAGLVATSCASGPQPTPNSDTAPTPDAPFRAQRPAPSGELSFSAPTVKELTLSNGLVVYLVERHELPLVTMDLVVRTGRDADPSGKEGLAGFEANMLGEGTEKLTAPQISAAFEDLAIHFEAYGGNSTTHVSLGTLTTSLDRALDVFSDVVLNPAFRAPDIERVRGERLAQLIASHDDPGNIAFDVMVRALYGDHHPWGAPSTGSAEGIKSITRDDLIRFHSTYFVPGNAALIVVGDVQPDALKVRLEKRFASWKGSGAATPKLAEVKDASGREILFVDKPLSQQSQIWFGEMTLEAANPDYVPLDVMNSILGGLFSSRLNLNLREGKGWSYGVSSFLQTSPNRSPWFAAGGFVADKTSDSVAEMLKELDRMHTGTVTDTELADAKDAMVRQLPGYFETNSSTAGTLAGLLSTGLPIDYYSTYPDRLRAVQAADIARVAQKYLNPAHMTVVVVGPPAEKDKIAALNAGSVSSRDEYGKPTK